MEENIYHRNSEQFQKVIQEQSKAFRKVHELLEIKTKMVCNLRKENISLKAKIKELELENRRLKND